MIIFGWGNRYVKDYGETDYLEECIICSRLNLFHFVRLRDWFDLFFVPIIPYNTEYYLVCPHCENSVEIESQKEIDTFKDYAKNIGGEDE